MNCFAQRLILTQSQKPDNSEVTYLILSRFAFAEDDNKYCKNNNARAYALGRLFYRLAIPVAVVGFLPVPTTPEELDNASLFLRLGLYRLHHSITKTKLLENTSSNRENLKTPTLRFSVDGKHFEKRAFRKS